MLKFEKHIFQIFLITTFHSEKIHSSTLNQLTTDDQDKTESTSKTVTKLKCK